MPVEESAIIILMLYSLLCSTIRACRALSDLPFEMKGMGEKDTGGERIGRALM